MAISYKSLSHSIQEGRKKLMNNKKGQLNMGTFLMVFIVILVGVVVFQATTQLVGKSTNTVTLGGVNNNQTILSADLPENAGTVDLIGQDLLSTPVVTNESDGRVVLVGNYTIGERVSPTTGVKTVYLQIDDAEIGSTSMVASGAVGLNITYVHGPDGYIAGSGARSVAGLIAIFFALAIAVIALEPTIRSKVIEGMGK